jgi:hypothetical protein
VEPALLAVDSLGQRPHAHLRQGHAPVLAALSLPHDELSAVEVHVLHAEPNALGHAQAAAVHQLDAQPVRVLQLAQDRADLALAQHHGQPPWPTRRHDPLDPRERASQDVRIQELERGERLVLRRGRDLILQRQRRQEPRDVRLAELRRVAPPVLHDEPSDPEDVGRLGTRAVPPLA